MALKESTMLALGTAMPDFALPDVCTQKVISPETFREKHALLVMFICRHCPYVVHVQHELTKLGIDYQGKDLGILAISSNDVIGYPADAPPRLKEMVEQLGWQFPYCYDETQDVAKAFTAACTPDFFVFDRQRHLVYRGQLDESRPGNGKPVTGQDLRAALDAVLAGKPVSNRQHPSAGCNIKWKTGNEPDYG
ncbi:MAG: thioredoxin family protein [Nitrospirota bacterium]|nr:MAG: thioredoxin family protein [Nitrospirota bacterium]